MTAWSSIYWGMRRRDPALHVGPGHHIFFLSTLQSVRNTDSPEGQEETRVGRAPLFTGLGTSHSWRKREMCSHCCWSFSILATWCKEPAHWKRPWSWERLRAGGEAGGRERDGWMVLPSPGTGVWANSGRRWRTGKPVCLSPWGCKESDTTAAERRLLLLSQTRWRFRLGTEELFSVSHLFAFPARPSGFKAGSPAPVLHVDSRVSPQDFVHTCLLRLFTALPRPLSNHHVPPSALSISPISGTTEPSWDPGSEDSMYVCCDVFFIWLFRIFNMCGKLHPSKPSVGLVFSWVWLNVQMLIRKVTKT